MPSARKISPILAAAAITLAGVLEAAEARVVGFDILSRGPAYSGASFGEVGPYERIDAVARFAVDPASPRAAKIVDIDAAPTNGEGEVEFSTEVTILRPSAEAAGSGALFYEVPNRGRNLGFPLLNLSPSAGNVFSVDDPGDGFLMSRGHVLVWSGWQSGLGEPLIDMTLPVLPDVVGQSREEFIFDEDEPVSTATLTYPAADLDPASAALTVRATPSDERQTPEGLSFRYIDPTTIEITRPEGFDAGAIYEFVYPAKDAVPAGLAFAATADLVSFLRGSPGHDVESPLAGIDRTIGMGISQSGRFLRDFIYQGFNADEGGRRVFDGAMPHIAGSRKTFTNYRFAQPGRYSRQHEDHDFPGDQFPFTYAEAADPISGRTESILTACSVTGTCPKVMHTDTSTEFWQARASLLTTSPSGEPLRMPEDVRLFFLAGAPHFTTWGGDASETAICVYPSNPLSVAPAMRALLVAMDEWLKDGTAPPEGIYPSLSDRTLVQPEAIKLPMIDGTTPNPPVNPLALMDHSGVPPIAGARYPVLVPAVDEDGIPEGGIRLPYVSEPLGTYWGWNLRKAGYAPGQLCGLTGSFVPFPENETEDDSRRPPARGPLWQRAGMARGGPDGGGRPCRAGPDAAKRRRAGGGRGRARPVSLSRVGSSHRSRTAECRLHGSGSSCEACRSEMPSARPG